EVVGHHQIVETSTVEIGGGNTDGQTAGGKADRALEGLRSRGPGINRYSIVSAINRCDGPPQSGAKDRGITRRVAGVDDRGGCKRLSLSAQPTPEQKLTGAVKNQRIGDTVTVEVLQIRNVTDGDAVL